MSQRIEVHDTKRSTARVNDMFYHYGVHRVLQVCSPNTLISSTQDNLIERKSLDNSVPKCLPQAAWKVDSTPKLLHQSEILIDVNQLCLDSTSATCLRVKFHDNEKEICQEIMNIVNMRGKMHNPYTSSGGVLIGTIKEIGSLIEKPLKIGVDITPLISLTCIPLQLESVDSFDGEIAKVHGTAVLFPSYRYCLIPSDIPRDIVMTALDISSIVPQVQREISCLVDQNKKSEKKELIHVYIVGCGKSGIAVMAAIRASIYSKQIKIITTDISQKRVEDCRNLGYADVCEKLDGQDVVATLTFIQEHTLSTSGVDLVVNTTNAILTETASIIAARDYGIVILFSMATQFDRAALATDAVGKDVQVKIGVGIADDQDTIILDLLRKDEKLRMYFASRI
ncbi:unnamed protein product [Rotaria sp. Silwood2]|nr:unnamed protein product [Rotaria sp. Silwood2]CAF4488941.1 unnamed protein product [Rotaria sp. Silwood2]